jgi:hypothetical protein
MVPKRPTRKANEGVPSIPIHLCLPLCLELLPVLSQPSLGSPLQLLVAGMLSCCYSLLLRFLILQGTSIQKEVVGQESAINNLMHGCPRLNTRLRRFCIPQVDTNL